MHYAALATDYDGTLAHHGVVAPHVVEALERFLASGRRLIMVTGRELNELLAIFPRCDLFEQLVVENGALLYTPKTQTAKDLAPSPPAALVEELKKCGMPCSVGRSIIATVEPHEHTLLSIIRKLGLEWHVIFNKGSVMALPSSVTKATGLAAALAAMDLPPDRIVGVGDAENDHAFLRTCGCAVAVANALPAVKAAVDLVTDGVASNGVVELIDRILATDLRDVKPHPALHQPNPTTPV